MMILLNPGPANTTETVKKAQTLPDICPREKEFGQVMLRVRDRLAQVIAPDDDDVTSVLFCGSGTAGVEAAVCSTVPPNGRLLVIENGAYGERMADMAAAYGIPHDVERFGVGGYPDCERVAARLDGGGYTQLAVVHHETSTGMLNPVPRLGALCKQHGVEMIVDAMSSFAGLPMTFEGLGADYLVSSSNKCIQGMAGLSFVICRRSRLAELTPYVGRSLYLNLPQQHHFFEAGGNQMRFTPPVQVVYALDQAIEEYFAEDGGHGRHRRYRANWEALDGGMRQLGFRRLHEESMLSRILTAYVEPDHPAYDFDGLHDRLYEKGFTIYPGKGAVVSTFRLANMGAVTPDDMRAFIAALKETIDEMGLDPLYSREAGVTA